MAILRLEERIQAFDKEVAMYRGTLDDPHPLKWTASVRKCLDKHLKGESPVIHFHTVIKKLPDDLVTYLYQSKAVHVDAIEKALDNYYGTAYMFNKFRKAVETHELFIGLSSQQAKHRAFNICFRSEDSSVLFRQIMLHLAATFYYRFEDAGVDVPRVKGVYEQPFIKELDAFFERLEEAEAIIRDRNHVRDLAEVIRQRRMDVDPEGVALEKRRYVPISECEALKEELLAKDAKLAQAVYKLKRLQKERKDGKASDAKATGPSV